RHRAASANAARLSAGCRPQPRASVVRIARRSRAQNADGARASGWMSERDVWASVAGEQLRLLGERAVFWERVRTLFVADPHFGKAAAFRAAGVLVPRGTTGETLSRLDAALDRTGAERIVFLG